MKRRKRTVRLSSKGQIVIPADLRKELGLKMGGTLQIRTTSSRELVLSPEPAGIDLDAALAAGKTWAERTGRDLVEELHEARRKERIEEKHREARYR